jgi:acylglycerol lipase
MKNVYLSLLLLSACLFLYNLHAVYNHQLDDQHDVTVKGMKPNKKEPEYLPAAGSIKASDQTILAYVSYVPDNPKAALIFYHGSGANSEAGYPYMAEQLSKKYNVAAYLFDIRGHGRSGGPRGDAPSSAAIWSDVSNASHFVREKHNGIPLFLGGHSSGAGMLINYAAWAQAEQPDGYVFVAPMLGRDAGVVREREKKSDCPFVEVYRFSLLVHYITGGLIGGHWTAVTFAYPEHLVKERGFVTAYTVNMLGAMHPEQVQKRLLLSQVPTWIFIADQDELFDPEKIDRFLEPVLQKNNNIHAIHLTDAHHLTILGEVHDEIVQVIKNVH